MSGWWAVVDKRSPEERDASEDKFSGLIASWECGSGDMDFLHKLVSDKKAVQYTFSGYPNRFTALARDFIPHIVNGPPAPHSFTSNVTLKKEEIDLLDPDHMLTIDVWDQS